MSQINNFFYKPPFKDIMDCGYIYDSNNLFSFMFDMNVPEEAQVEILQVINGEKLSTKNNFILDHDDPTIILLKSTNEPCIIIRGWGQLTGSGGYNFSSDKACEIQDSLVQYILTKLNVDYDSN